MENKKQTAPDLKKPLNAIDDQDLAAISGGTGDWWEERGYYPKYSIGQRVRCLYFYDNGANYYYIQGEGVVKKIDFMDKGPETFNYLVELDIPDPSGEKLHWIFFDGILGPD